MKITVINVPREKMTKHKGVMRLKNIKGIEISEREAGRIADILAQSEGIFLEHREGADNLHHSQKDIEGTDA